MRSTPPTKLVNVEGVAAIVGALTSGGTITAAQSVAIPSGILMLSPTATAPSMTDDGRTTTSCSGSCPRTTIRAWCWRGCVFDKGLKRVALTYANNDYALGIAEPFRKAFKALGGEITADQVHEEKKASYRSELATLAQGDAQALVLIAYAGDSGITIVRQSLENGFFEPVRRHRRPARQPADRADRRRRTWDLFFTSPTVTARQHGLQQVRGRPTPQPSRTAPASCSCSRSTTRPS